MCDEYKRYLQEYTRKYNRQAEIYGYQKIKEEDAEKHVVVGEVKKYYEEMEGRHKKKRSISKRKITVCIANILP